MLEHALSYAARGWYVIPCYPMRGGICGCGRPQCVSPGKHPANENGLTECTVDEAQIRAWWAAMPDASIGIVMEPSGLCALDLDIYHKDLEKLAVLERELGPLPATVTQRSGSGDGFHAILKSLGFPVRGVIGGIVVRSRAYIIVAPSNHTSGGNYSWQEGLAPGEIEVAEFSETWKEALRKTADVGQVGAPSEEPEWLAAVPQERRIADMRAHFARESGEVKGTSGAGTTFHIVRTAIRAHAVRDSEAALEAAMEFDAKCVPPWGARMARHVWSAYQKAHAPEWGANYRGEEQRLDALGLSNVPVLPAFPAPPDIVVRTELEKVRTSRAPSKLLDKKILAEFVIPTQGGPRYLGENDELAAQALVRNCPAGTSDNQMATYLIACMVPDDRARELIRAARGPASAPSMLASLADSLPLSEPAELDDDQALLGTLKLDTEGEGVKNTPSNIAKILEGATDVRGSIKFNALTKQVEVLADRFAGISANILATAIMNWLDARWQLVANRTQVEDQLLLLARQNAYNPIADYLLSCLWDGVRRIDGWLVDFCGAEDTEFNRRVGAMWLISAAARGIAPGSKVDTVLVLEGIQGSRKSSSLKVLAGKWFSDSPLVIGNKDSMQMTSYRWIIELAELSSLRTSETEAQKAFIAASVDNYRPPYGKAPEEFERFAIFGGSTNQDEYLPDASGNRRYWPVKVSKCDTQGLRQIRDQLWAEATYRYLHADLNPELAHPECPGERWWFETDAEQDMAAAVVSKRRPENTWAGLIKEWARKTSVVGAGTRRQWTLAEIAHSALDVEIEKIPGRQRGITEAVREAGLIQVFGPDNQQMWKLPDTLIPDVGVVEQGLRNSN